jgi:hypothetical protein
VKILVAAAVLATLVASPALAQSYDPDIGTGNIVPWGGSPAYSQGYQPDARASARVAPGRRQAQSPYNAYGAVTPLGDPRSDQSRKNNASTAREAAVRECSSAAAPYRPTTWGNMGLHQYRVCMMRHGQPE